MQLLHALNPNCNQPLHSTLHRLAYWGGNTTTFRGILSRLGILDSNESARLDRIYDSQRQNTGQRKWFKVHLKKGKYFMFVDDNLDWRGQASRLHMYAHSGNDTGIHILMRQCNLMNLPVDLDNFAGLGDVWNLRSEITYEDVTEHTLAEIAAAGKHVEQQLARAVQSGYTAQTAETLIAAFTSLQAKTPGMTEEELQMTQATTQSQQERTRIYYLDKDGAGQFKSTQGPRTDIVLSTRLQRNLGVLGNDTWSVALEDVPALEDHSYDKSWPTTAVAKGDQFKVQYAFETAFLVIIGDGETAYLVPDSILFADSEEEPASVSAHLAVGVDNSGTDPPIVSEGKPKLHPHSPALFAVFDEYRTFEKTSSRAASDPETDKPAIEAGPTQKKKRKSEPAAAAPEPALPTADDTALESRPPTLERSAVLEPSTGVARLGSACRSWLPAWTRLTRRTHDPTRQTG